MKRLINTTTLESVTGIDQSDASYEGVQWWSSAQYQNYVLGIPGEDETNITAKYRKLQDNNDGTYSIIEMSVEEKEVADALEVYNQKYQEHRGLRYKVTVNYDYLFSSSAYLPLTIYCLGKDDIISYTARVQDAEGNISNIAYICSDTIRADHLAIFQADSHFIIEDLLTYAT